MSISSDSNKAWYCFVRAFFGAFTGYVLMKSSAYFHTEGSWTKKLGRYVIGIIGVLVAMYGLDILFSLLAGDESLAGYILRYIRYAATTFWVMFGAPWVFLKLKLVEEKS